MILFLVEVPMIRLKIALSILLSVNLPPYTEILSSNSISEFDYIFFIFIIQFQYIQQCKNARLLIRVFKFLEFFTFFLFFVICWITKSLILCFEPDLEYLVILRILNRGAVPLRLCKKV